MHDVNTTVQVLIHLLAHKDEIVRQRAAAALGTLISAPNALGALQSLCDLLRVEWNEDVRRAALCSITQLSELDVMRVVDSLVAACKQDSSGAAEEGLIAVAELLNLKILNEEEKFVEHTQQVIVEQTRLEEVCVCVCV